MCGLALPGDLLGEHRLSRIYEAGACDDRGMPARQSGTWADYGFAGAIYQAWGWQKLYAG